MKSKFIIFLLAAVVLVSLIGEVVGQSTTTVYSENFNSGPGGWSIGGYNASWNYGVPTLPNISSNGTACFVTGDAGVAQAEPFTSCLPVPGPSPNGNYYNCCERSFILSPSINLTGINSPMLSLDFNIHCEQTYDGAKVQLSIDGGLSWQDVGTYNSATFQMFPSSINCREQNWYNKDNVNYLSGTSGGCTAVSFTFGGSKNGWSGGCSQAASGACTTPDAHGSNGWLTATHCLQAAANKSDVRIRIAFGAGSQVFSDGIGIDNVKILNVYPITNFTNAQLPSCGPEITFTNTTDCGATWSWDFGHPGSPGNTSTSSNPVHLFPSSGTYMVSLTATDFCGGNSVVTKNVLVGDGQSPKIDSVKSTSSGLCNNAVDTIAIYLTPTSTGTGPYTVSLNHNGSNLNFTGLNSNPILITGLQPGNYSAISVTDAIGCMVNFVPAVTIPLNLDSLSITLSNDTTILAGAAAPLFVQTTITATFSWMPVQGISDPASASPLASPENTTTYTVVAVDVNGCSVQGDVVVYVNDVTGCDSYFVPNTFTPNGDGNNDVFSFFIDPAMRLNQFELKIYNRWGQNVFETKNQNFSWKGDNNPGGIYLVVADFVCRNKTKSRFTGTLNLVR